MQPVSYKRAYAIGNAIGINWSVVPLRWWTHGLNVELELGRHWARVSPAANVTNDDLLATAGIALAHLIEFPDYYQRLAVMERQADAYWSERHKPAVLR